MSQPSSAHPRGDWKPPALLKWLLAGGGAGYALGAAWTVVDAYGRPPNNMLPVSIAIYGSLAGACGAGIGGLLGLVCLPLRRAWVKRHGTRSTALPGSEW